MKECTVDKKMIVTAEGKHTEISYCIVTEELTGEDGRFVCECYGISVLNNCGEKNTVLAITMSLKRIHQLAEKLADCDVLPIELPEAVENCLYR